MSPSTQGIAHPEVVSERIPRRRPGWIELATSAEHKAIGRMYVATALFFGAVALTELVMMRLQLIVADNTFIRPDVFDRLLSAYGATALILFALPLAIGLFSYVVPLQIGARGMALPRLHHLSYWLYLFGGVSIYLSFLYRPSVAGTIALPPLSDISVSLDRGVDAWLIGVGLALLGFILFAVSMIATVRSSRAPGLVWRRVPLFSWAAAVVSYTLLVVSAVMLAAITMLIIDRHFSGVFFVPNEGGSPLLYEHLTSIFLAGAYISVVIAAFGTISEILPTFSRQPHFGQATIAGSFIALAVLAVLAWMQNMLAAPIPIGFLYFAMLMALAAAIPVGLIVFNWIATLGGGSVRMRSPMLFALGAIVFTISGLAGELAQSVVPVGWQLANTATAWGDTHAALIGAGVLGGFAGLHYWFPKITGRLMGESLARASFWALAVGSLMLIVPMQIAGLQGMPADVYEFSGDDGLGLVNLLASLGALVFAVGFILTLINAAASYGRGVEVGPDPWHGGTLEWFAPSPPPVHNFDLVPDVRSGEPLHDIRDAIRRRNTRWSPPPAVPADRELEPVAVGVGAREQEEESAEPPPETAAEPAGADSEASPQTPTDAGDDADPRGEGDRPVA
ncbi:MAG: cbb3-type cytochrome c oxidase subunit I [Solirubrobacterales bacterium]|nr:cbb3-type cytochrome c oxidase subunit I [Solirubrobacterales bacterium]